MILSSNFNEYTARDTLLKKYAVLVLDVPVVFAMGSILGRVRFGT